MGELIAARAAVTIAITSWRVAPGLEEAEFAERFNELGRGHRDDPGHRLGRDRAPARRRASRPGRQADSSARREADLGPALEPLTYDHPIQMASARGVWMTDTDGRTYLDAYNNVPCVGHAIRASPRPSPGARGPSTRTCGTCTRTRSSSPSG